MESESNFLKAIWLPAAMIFVLPVVVILFCSYAISSYQDEFMAGMAAQLGDQFPAEQNIHVVDLCGELGMGADGCSVVLQFHYGRIAAFGAIALGLFGFALMFLLSRTMNRSRKAQFRSLQLGIRVLRGIASIEVVLQAAMLVFLSFWVTAFFFGVYFLKIIFIVGALALVAVGAVLKAAFHEVEDDAFINGVALSKTDAPHLWTRVGEICTTVGSSMPDQIVGGVDDSFFVSESDLVLRGDDETPIYGKTLYVSLPALRQMDSSYVDAIIAHEMAHFSGGDAAYSKKVAPLIRKFDIYLHYLDETIAIPVYHFLLAFRVLIESSLGNSSREREFRADRIAAETTSPETMSNALLTFVAYSIYRSKTEEELFEELSTIHGKVDIASRVSDGFSNFVSSGDCVEEMPQVELAHPFDTHPPLVDRITALHPIDVDDYSTVLIRDPTDTYLEQNPALGSIETALWERYENELADLHEQVLAYRYLPANDNEIAIVEKHFPAYESPYGADPIVITYDGLSVDGDKILFDDVISMEVKDGSFGNQLIVQHVGTTKIKLKDTLDQDLFLAMVSRYYERHQIARAHAEEAAAAMTD